MTQCFLRSVDQLFQALPTDCPEYQLTGGRGGRAYFACFVCEEIVRCQIGFSSIQEAFVELYMVPESAWKTDCLPIRTKMRVKYKTKIRIVLLLLFLLLLCSFFSLTGSSSFDTMVFRFIRGITDFSFLKTHVHGGLQMVVSFGCWCV